MIRTIASFLASAAIVMILAIGLRADQAATVDWDSARDRVSVSIDALDLEELLKTIAIETGWKVRYEPGLGHVVSAKFRNEDQRTALRDLLAPLNFSFITSATSPGELVVYRERISRATSMIEEEESAHDDSEIEIGFIGDELIVVLKPDSPFTIEGLAARWGATIVRRNDDLRAYVLKFPDEDSATLAKTHLAEDESVASVENNQRIASPGSPQLISGGPGALNYALKAGTVSADSPIVIGVVDTGFNIEGSSLGELLLGSLQLAGEVDGYPEITHGHMMVETILANLHAALGGADTTGVRFATADIYGGAESTTSYLVGEALARLYNEHDVTLFNLSLGGTEPSPFVESIVQSLAEKGVTMVAAAGNEPTSDPSYPATYEGVISTTAGTNGAVAEYANRADTVDAMVSGNSVVRVGDQYIMMNGTSVAAAQVSGMIAGAAEATGTTPIQAGTEVAAAFPPPAGD